jgi:hypothetical protein
MKRQNYEQRKRAALNVMYSETEEILYHDRMASAARKRWQKAKAKLDMAVAAEARAEWRLRNGLPK